MELQECKQRRSKQMQTSDASPRSKESRLAMLACVMKKQMQTSDASLRNEETDAEQRCQSA
jgi:hypothetical protein